MDIERAGNKFSFALRRFERRLAEVERRLGIAAEKPIMHSNPDRQAVESHRNGEQHASRLNKTD